MVRRKWNSRKKKKRSSAAAVLLMFVLVVFFVGGAWLLLEPYGPSSETFVDVAVGSSTVQIGRQLQQAGIVRSGIAFDLLRWIKRGRLEAGEYRFDHPAPMLEVYGRMVRGDVYTRTLVIPEGSNIFDIATRVQEAGLGSRQQFLKAAMQETDLVADLDPGAKSLEGYLFPDTYRFPRHTTPAHIVAVMVHRFRTEAAKLGLKENVHRVVTIASLVERETAVPVERPMVASVFENRLAKNMPLMTDPALIYGLELSGDWRGAIYQSDLQRNSPWNTYRHAGLPPGPIANPGLASLRAVMHPAQTDYLYFVAAGADAQGHSLFASTLDQHNHNVAQYRKALKMAGAR